MGVEYAVLRHLNAPYNVPFAAIRTAMDWFTSLLRHC